MGLHLLRLAQGCEAYGFHDRGPQERRAATISAPGFTEANKADYKAAVEAVVPMAISKAQAQKDAKTKG